MHSTLHAGSERRTNILSLLGASERGLSSEQIAVRRQRFGWNELPIQKGSILTLFFSQFRNAMVAILLAAAAVSVLAPFLHSGVIHRQELLNAMVILAIVLINAVLGFTQEWRSENAIALLKKLSASQVRVRRDQKIQVIPSRELVPGDILMVETGDRISADARLIASASLEVDESSLTGESLPADKQAQERLTPEQAPPGMLYAATLVTRGSGEAVVTGTGLLTEIGKITSMVMTLKPPLTPLAIELQRVGQRIGLLVIVLCVLIFAAGVLAGMEVTDMFFTAVSLAVAAVPEGLPAIVTICLAIGVQRMIKHHALIRRLDAVETLGAVTVICADKTGTMTMNCMTVSRVWTLGDFSPALSLQIAASCNRAELPDIGDPTEVALLIKARDEGIERLPIVDEKLPFTSEAKHMVTLHRKDGQSVRYLKGAPEVIATFLPESSRDEVLRESEKLSREGLRVLAVARGTSETTECIGLIALIDPPRPGVQASIEQAKRAGIRTIMITGDHPATALTIAQNVGIESDSVIDGETLERMDILQLQKALKRTSVFARVQPVHKVKILEALQTLDDTVAMSGDGVNDAPALKRAHVGIAMGMKGTDVAREAAAMVLTDDNYSTIVAAIAEGRRIYDNIKKFVLFLVRCNVGEVLLIAFAMLLQMPLPLLPLHILWINLVTDSFPALALAAEEGEEGIMDRPPRRRGKSMFSDEWMLLLCAGLLNATCSLGMFAIVRSQYPDDLTLARTVVLTTTIVYQLLLAISTRTSGSVFRTSLFSNRWLIGAIALSLGLHLLLLLSPLHLLFNVVPIPLILWEETLGAAFLAFLMFEGAKLVRNKVIR